MRVIRENGILRAFQEYEIEDNPFFETVKPIGNGCKINCSKKYEGKKVLVAVLK